jgi:RNA polymerase sigma-70 factor (ECF subfamily)
LGELAATHGCGSSSPPGFASDSFEAIVKMRHPLGAAMMSQSAEMPELEPAPAADEDDARAAGNRAAIADLRSLYADHADFVRGAVIRLGGPGADVEDLVHDVFLVALKRQASFEGRSSPRTWLYGIAIKLVAGARRKAGLRRFLGLERAPAAADERTPARLFEDREASATLYRALDAMAEKKRTVFVLYELEGLSGEEIAAVVGCPLKTVWTRLFHARKELSASIARAAAAESKLIALDSRRRS